MPQEHMVMDFFYTTSNAYDFSDVCYPLGYGSVRTQTQIGYSWYQETRDDHIYRYFVWSATVRMIDYSDIFADPINLGIEIPGGQAYSYYHTWTNSRQLADADWVMIE